MSIAQLDVALDRPLPQAPECERAVLGSCLTNQKSYWRVCSILTEIDFFKDAHRVIWRAIRAICEEGGADLDILTLKHELANGGLLDQAGSEYVSALVDGIPDIGNVEHYARIVREKANRRRIITTCNWAMREALDPAGDSAQEISSQTASRLQETAIEGARASRPIYDMVLDVEREEERLRAAGRDSTIRVGLQTLDYEDVIREEALTIVAARSRAGKTTFMINCAAGAARNGYRVAFFSLETPEREFWQSLGSHMSQVLLDDIRRGSLNETQQYKVNETRKELQEWKREGRFYFGNRLRDIDSIMAECRRLKTTQGLNAIFIDYLQLLRGEDHERSRDREQDMDRISRRHLVLAQDLKLAVVSGSQVNKEATKRANGRLSLDDMEYGKVIGEHCTVALMFQRPRQDDPSLDGRDGRKLVSWHNVLFQIEKNKNHKTYDPLMHADMAYQSFSEGDCAKMGCGSGGQFRLS